MVLNTYHSLFLISHLCVFTCITWKLQVIHRRSVYWITALLLETFSVWFRVAWEIRLESYGPRHALAILWYLGLGLLCLPKTPVVRPGLNQCTRFLNPHDATWVLGYNLDFVRFLDFLQISGFCVAFWINGFVISFWILSQTSERYS